jgi:hypothetical protein
VPRERLPREGLAQRLEGLLDPRLAPEREADLVRALATLDLVPEGFPLRRVLTGAVVRNAAGLYHHRDDVILLPEDGSAGDSRRAIELHELAHALADQAFGLDALIDDPAAAERDDLQLARRALAEGDAQLTAWLAERQPDETLELDPDRLRRRLTEAWTSGREPAGRSDWLVAQIVEPYVLGFRLVADAWRQGGLEAVNALWKDPPLSSEALRHRERRSERPEVLLPPSPQPGERRMTGFQLGELGIEVWLSSRLAPQRARSAALGWDGDRVDLFRSGAPAEGESGERVVVTTHWDTGDDAEEFATAAEAWLFAGYGSGSRFRVMRRGPTVTVELHPAADPAEPIGEDPWEGVTFGAQRSTDTGDSLSKR